MNKLLAAACLLAMASARGLIKHPAVDFKAQTDKFAPPADESIVELDGAKLAGLICGCVAYFGFVIFTLVIFVVDNIRRHRMYDEMIEAQKKILREEYKCSEEDINNYVKAFYQEGKKKETKDDAIDLVN